MVEGLVLDGYVFPIHQFSVAGPDACAEAHYHSRTRVCSIGTLGIFDLIICHPSLESGENDEAVIDREVVYKPDPDPGGCGFGKVSEVRKASSVVSYICFAYWYAYC